MSTFVATIKAYKRKGRGIVVVERPGRPTHRYRIGLLRYRLVSHWLDCCAGKRWRTSGVWSRVVTVSLWEKEVTKTQ